MQEIVGVFVRWLCGLAVVRLHDFSQSPKLSAIRRMCDEFLAIDWHRTLALPNGFVSSATMSIGTGPSTVGRLLICNSMRALAIEPWMGLSAGVFTEGSIIFHTCNYFFRNGRLS